MVVARELGVPTVRAQVFQWDKELPIGSHVLPNNHGLFVSTIRTLVIDSYSGKAPLVIQKPRRDVVSCFDVGELLSPENRRRLIREFLPDTVQFLADRICRELSLGYFGSPPKHLLLPGAPRTVIAVQVDRTFIAECNSQEDLPPHPNNNDDDDGDGIHREDCDQPEFPEELSDVKLLLRSYMKSLGASAEELLDPIELSELEEQPALVLLQGYECVDEEFDEGSCTICLQGLITAGKAVVRTAACLHVFHLSCGWPLLFKHFSCPVCRLVLL